MSEKILSTIHDALGWALLGAMESSKIESYRSQWISGATEAAASHQDFKEVFRSVLLFTRAQNRRFGLDGVTADTVNRMVLDKFLEAQGAGAAPDSGRPGREPQHSQARPATFQGANGRLGNSGSVPSSMHLVFHAMLQSIASRFDSRFGRTGVLKSKFLSSLPGLKLAPGASHAIRNWAAVEHFNGSLNAIEENEMREIIDGVYTICCDEFGPVLADALLSESAQVVQEMPEAAHYPVRRLL